MKNKAFNLLLAIIKKDNTEEEKLFIESNKDNIIDILNNMLAFPIIKNTDDLYNFFDSIFINQYKIHDENCLNECKKLIDNVYENNFISNDYDLININLDNINGNIICNIDVYKICNEKLKNKFIMECCI